ncbi:hypothetical protein [Mycolicibacterium mengxianglii]|uniref:hypothetical protein n=1 Tax=Mycolicibacterium mengxianglii TaxID=2736649 RepID=UPI0018D16C38|nr:hypothetical protein [Mycolicibacterium mengxianglii]
MESSLPMNRLGIGTGRNIFHAPLQFVEPDTNSCCCKYPAEAWATPGRVRGEAADTNTPGVAGPPERSRQRRTDPATASGPPSNGGRRSADSAMSDPTFAAGCGPALSR